MKVFDTVHLITQAQAGSRQYLVANGIELVILCHQGLVFPHSKAIGALAINIEEDGTHPDWIIRGMANLLANEVYEVKTIGLADKHGGFMQAGYMLTCAGAVKQAVPFATFMATLEGLDVPLDIPAELIAQGEALWPAP